MCSDVAGVMLLLAESSGPISIALRIFVHLLQQHDIGVPHCTCGACLARVSSQLSGAPGTCARSGCTRTEYRRVKLTINNFNRFKNYSDRDLVVQHLNLLDLTQVFSFAYEPLVQRGTISKLHLLVFQNFKYFICVHINTICSLLSISWIS